MKKIFLFLLPATLIFMAFKTVNDILTDVGTTIEEVKNVTMRQIANEDFNMPYYNYSVKQACKKLPPGVREATMLSLGKVIRNFVESPDFKPAYEAYLEKEFHKTHADPNSSRYAEEKQRRFEETLKSLQNDQVYEMFAQQVDGQLEMAKSYQEIIKDNPNMDMGLDKKQIQKNIQDYTLLKELKAKDKEAFKKKYAEIDAENMLAQKLKTEQGYEAKELEQIAARKDYRAIVKNQLQQFLKQSADVDFNAKLVQRNNKMYFENPAYEKKSYAWKLYYRAGKEAVGGARTFAQEWLSSMK